MLVMHPRFAQFPREVRQLHFHLAKVSHHYRVIVLALLSLTHWLGRRRMSGRAAPPL